MFGAIASSLVHGEAMVTEEIPWPLLVAVNAIGGLVTLIFLVIFCTECIGRFTARKREREQLNRHMPSRRSRQTAPISIPQPRQIAEPESPSRHFSEVLRPTYRRISQSSIVGHEDVNANLEIAEEIMAERHRGRPVLIPPVERHGERNLSSGELDTYSVLTNSPARPDLESTYVERMHDIGEQLKREPDPSPSSGDSPPMPVTFGRYRPTPPPCYMQALMERNHTPPPNYSMAQNQQSEDSWSPEESSEGERMDFYMSMSDDSKENDFEEATPPVIPMFRKSSPLMEHATTRPIDIPQKSPSHPIKKDANPRVAMGLVVLRQAVEKMKRTSCPVTEVETRGPEQSGAVGGDSTDKTKRMAQGARRDNIGAGPRGVDALTVHKGNLMGRTKTIAWDAKKGYARKTEIKDEILWPKELMGRDIKISSSWPGAEIVGDKTIARDARDVIRRTEPEIEINLPMTRGAETKPKVGMRRGKSKTEPKAATDDTVEGGWVTLDEVFRAWAQNKPWTDNSEEFQAQTENAIAAARKSRKESPIHDETESAIATTRSRTESPMHRAKMESSTKVLRTEVHFAIKDAIDAARRSRTESPIHETESAIATTRSRMESPMHRAEMESATKVLRTEVHLAIKDAIDAARRSRDETAKYRAEMEKALPEVSSHGETAVIEVVNEEMERARVGMKATLNKSRLESALSLARTESEIAVPFRLGAESTIIKVESEDVTAGISREERTISQDDPSMAMAEVRDEMPEDPAKKKGK